MKRTIVLAKSYADAMTDDAEAGFDLLAKIIMNRLMVMGSTTEEELRQDAFKVAMPVLMKLPSEGPKFVSMNVGTREVKLNYMSNLMYFDFHELFFVDCEVSYEA